MYSLMHWIFLYSLVFLGSLAVSGVLCGLARRAGLRLGLMDVPAGRKAHARPIALTGGWGIHATFLGIVALGALLSGAVAARLPESLGDLRPYLDNIRGVRPQVLSVLGGALIVFILGLVDDLRPLPPKVKLLVQALATLPPILAGISITGFLPAPLGLALTVLWIIALTNSFNLLDNMDGLAASVALVICGVLALAAWQGGEQWLPALFLCLAGALGGFLFYHFHPASLFMGDAGSLTTGYLLGVFSILITYYQKGVPSGLPVLMPLVIMGVPLFDTLSVMFIRWRNGKPLMVGDRNHFSHRLLAMGFGVRATALTIALLAAAVGLLALPLRHLDLGAALIHMGGIVCLFCVIVALEFVGRRNA